MKKVAIGERSFTPIHLMEWFIEGKMNQRNSWLVFGAILFMAAPFAFVGCGDDDSTAKRCTSTEECGAVETCHQGSCVATCEDDASCTEGTICDDDAEVCVQGCRNDDGCHQEEYCDESTRSCVAKCRRDDQCPGEETCESGRCVDDTIPCADHGECPLANYCEESEGRSSHQTCVEMNCGIPWNSCEKCTDGPNGGLGEEDGPLIWDVAVICSLPHDDCPAERPRGCRGRFRAWDPSGEPFGEDLKDHVNYLTDDPMADWGFEQREDGAFFFPIGCYEDSEEPGETDIATIYVVNKAGKASNTLCYDRLSW